MAAARPKLFHVGVSRMLERIDPRPSQGRSHLLQNPHGDRDSILLVLCERVPPGAELVGVLDVPHSEIIMQTF